MVQVGDGVDAQLENNLSPRLNALRQKVAHAISMQIYHTNRLAGSRTTWNPSNFDFSAPEKIFLPGKKFVL